jgi:uncharacterized LabA/DUF88 family protein
VKDLVGVQLTPAHIEKFCRAALLADETIRGVAYYDCPPFDESRPLPVSGTLYDFQTHPNYWKTFKFQEALLKNNFFSYRLGTISFDGWRLKRDALKELSEEPRRLSDEDFEPILVERQIEMMIALDIAKLSTTKFVDRLILVTSDVDLIPVIRVARSNGTMVTIITGNRKTVHQSLIRACDEHRPVPGKLALDVG